MLLYKKLLLMTFGTFLVYSLKFRGWGISTDLPEGGRVVMRILKEQDKRIDSASFG